MIQILGDNPQLVWMPIKPSATVYVGSLVSIDHDGLDEGIVVRPVAVGASNTTNIDRPLGICVGVNRRDPLYSSTYLQDYITDEGVTGLRTSTVRYTGVEGAWGKGDKQAYAQVALITPSTLLRAPIRDGAIGSTLTECTSASGNANGLTVTTDACDFTPVADLCTIYCREGLNAGLYRVTDDTSTTVRAWDRQMLSTTATVGETYVSAPLRVGMSYVLIGDGNVASFIDGSATPATNYDIIHVVNLNLSTAGKEYADFYFDGDAFCSARA